MAQYECKKYIHCPKCGKIMMKCNGKCNIEIECSKCHRRIIVSMDEIQITIKEKEVA